MLRLFPVCLLIALYTSCQDTAADDTEQEPAPVSTYADLDIVTGMDLYDANGITLGRWMTPNDNRGEIALFPVPSTSSFLLQVASSSPDLYIQAIWVVPATCLKDTMTLDIAGISKDLIYLETQVDSAAIQTATLDGQQLRSIAVSVDDLDGGLYRVFYKTSDGDLHWANTYIDLELDPQGYLDQLDALCH